ncbi:MAG: helix-turn-helix domain-containing protein [Acidimicrobiia bacterium]
MEANPRPLVLTVEQTAKVLGIGRSTAYDLVRAGDIPSLRLGRRLVIPAAAVADALDLPLEIVQQAVGPAPAASAVDPAQAIATSDQRLFQ